MPTISGIIVATGSEAAGRRPLSEVVDELARPYDATDSTIRALAGDAFRAAVRRMNQKGLWPWESLEEDITISSGVDKYTISGPVKKPLAMHFLTGSGGVRDRAVAYVPYDRFLEEYNLNLTSSSLLYTIPNLFETAQVLFWPTPNAADFARFSYYRVTPAPRTESETVEVPDYALETYMAFAWYELSKRLPAAQTRYPTMVAMQDAQRSFKELCAHVASPGDRTRSTMDWPRS